MAQPFFDDLRTKQQLGYAVAHRNTKQRDCIGVWFLIQSPQKSSEYCSGAINKHLLEKREAV